MKCSNILTTLGGALLAAVMAAGPVAAQTKIVMSNDNNSLGVKGQTFELFKKEIEDRLGDKVQVELHHGGSLFDQQTQVQGLQLGSAHIIAPGQGIYAPLAPKVNALSLPFLFSTAEAVQDATSDPEIRKEIFGELEAKNITPIAIWINGPRDFSTRRDTPIMVPDDLAGIKIRVQSTPVDLQTMELFGANPVGMSWSEVPTALQQGVIDAIEPVPNALLGAGLQEIVSQVSRVSWQYNFYIVGANKMWWESLPADVKEGVQEALAVATAWNLDNAEAENERAYDVVREMGKPVHDLTLDQRQAWVDAVAPIWQKFGVELVGQETVDRLVSFERKHQASN